MSKPCPNFQIKLYASYRFILELCHAESCFIPMWGNFLNEQRCRQARTAARAVSPRCRAVRHVQSSTSTNTTTSPFWEERGGGKQTALL